MATQITVWLDHEKAHIVTLQDNNESFNTIYSEADFRERYEGEKGQASRFGSQAVHNEKAKAAKLKKQFDAYYKTIIGELKTADNIYLLGPANAKHELSKLINNTELNNRLETVINSDKLTENQLKAKARELSS